MTVGDGRRSRCGRTSEEEADALGDWRRSRCGRTRSSLRLWLSGLICLIQLESGAPFLIGYWAPKFHLHARLHQGSRRNGAALCLERSVEQANKVSSHEHGVLDQGLSQRRRAGVRRRWIGEDVEENLESSMTSVSRHKLDESDIKDYEGDSLFCTIARLVCELTLIPRKELHENWEFASRINARFPQQRRIADLAGGNGLLGWMLLLLDTTGSLSVLCVDKVKPASACRITDLFLSKFPHLRSRHRFVEGDLGNIEPKPDVLLVSLHGCGRLSDRVIELAVQARCNIAVMPCCQSLAGTRSSLTITQHPRSMSALDHVTRMSKRWSTETAVDAARVTTLRHVGYKVDIDKIPADITPKNRVILASPSIQHPPPLSPYDHMGPIWPSMPLHASAWSRFRTPLREVAVPTVLTDERRVLTWGCNTRRDAFLRVLAMVSDSEYLFFYGTPDNDRDAGNFAHKGLKEAVGLGLVRPGPTVDFRTYFGVAKDSSWEDAIRLLGPKARVHVVLGLEQAPVQPLSENDFEEIARQFDWNVLVEARNRQLGKTSLQQVKIRCNRAHKGWRPLMPPQMESAARTAMHSATSYQAAVAVASPDETSKDIVEDKASDGDVFLILTDAYLCSALRLKPLPQSRP